MRHDPLADVFSALKNTEAIGRKECAVPNSKLIRSILKVIHDNKYIGGMDVVEDGRGGKVKVRLVGRINNCNVIKPSFSVKMSEFIKFEKRYLPAQNVGILILTTSKGIMDQHEAAKKGTGGRLLGYVY
jgi:small subunit ribosomal protein S8